MSTKSTIKILRALISALRYHGRDACRNLKNFNYIHGDSNETRSASSLTIKYHVLEKGLTMPGTRLGFGVKAVHELIDLLKRYNSLGYSRSRIEFMQSIRVINEYFMFHKKHDYELPASLTNEWHQIKEATLIKDCSHQMQYTASEFFNNSDSGFASFAMSRHSVRNYKEQEVSDDVITECVRIAQSAPSSCNRQPIKIYAIKKKEIILKALSLQTGNRGFGDLSSVVFVITSNLEYFHNLQERNDPSLNAGMFSMTFLLALHHFKLGACSLNWSATLERDAALRKALGIPSNEMIHMLISCGYPPDDFKVASSPRRSVDSILSVI